MPQTNVLPDWKLTYPNDAKAQKVPGVTISTTLGANAVPNKPTYAAGTIQIVSLDATLEEAAASEETPTEEAVVKTQEDAEEENMEEIEDEDGDGDDGPSRRTTKRTTTRTTTRRR
jgi:hypothetical protein